VFLTEAAATARTWTTAAPVFWQAVDDTCDAVVAEHFHGQSFVCDNAPDFLARHYFAMREWLATSGDPAKVSIANDKYAVLHSARYGPRLSGWQGGNSEAAAEVAGFVSAACTSVPEPVPDSHPRPRWSRVRVRARARARARSGAVPGSATH